jgi:hypothetical protein
MEGVQVTRNHYIFRQICVKNTAPLMKAIGWFADLEKDGYYLREDSDIITYLLAYLLQGLPYLAFPFPSWDSSAVPSS